MFEELEDGSMKKITNVKVVHEVAEQNCFMKCVSGKNNLIYIHFMYIILNMYVYLN